MEVYAELVPECVSACRIFGAALLFEGVVQLHLTPLHLLHLSLRRVAHGLSCGWRRKNDQAIDRDHHHVPRSKNIFDFRQFHSRTPKIVSWMGGSIGLGHTPHNSLGT